MKLCQHFHYKQRRGASQGFSSDCLMSLLPFSEVWDQASSPMIVLFLLLDGKWKCVIRSPCQDAPWEMNSLFQVRLSETQTSKKLYGFLSNSVGCFSKSSWFSHRLSQRFLLNHVSVGLYVSTSKQDGNPPRSPFMDSLLQLSAVSVKATRS